MKTLLMLLVLASMALSSGCSMTRSCDEGYRKNTAITEINMRGLVDDWEYLWLYDRSTMLTQWHPHVGN